MAKWFVMSEDGETLMKNGREGAETLEFENGREACNYAASFLIPFSEDAHAPTHGEERQLREVGKALEEQLSDDGDPEENAASEEEFTELAVVCVEKGIRIRMTREPLRGFSALGDPR